MPVILATQEAEIRRIARPCLENTQQKEGLEEWLKCLASVKSSEFKLQYHQEKKRKRYIC
jgi:hypothetical protein